jgi:hypothetical protein
MAGKARMATNNKCEWYTRGVFPDTIALTADLSSTTMTVASTTILTVDTILMDLETYEQIRVASVDSATQATVVRNLGSGATTRTIPSTTPLYIMDTARLAGGDALTAIGIDTTLAYNYVQQDEIVSGYTDRDEWNQYYGDQPKNQQTVNALREYKKRQARRRLLGRRAEGSGTTVPWTAGGLLEFILTDAPDNYIDAGGAFTFNELNAYISERVPFHPSGEFAMFGGINVCRIMNNWALSANQCNPISLEKYGVRVKEFFGGTWNAMLFPEGCLNATDKRGELLFILAMDEIRPVVAGGGTKTNKGFTGKVNGSHTIKDQISGFHSLEVGAVNAQMLVFNITS